MPDNPGDGWPERISLFDEQFIALFRRTNEDRSARLCTELLNRAATASLLVFLVLPLKFGDIAGHKILIQTVNRGSGLFEHFPRIGGGPRAHSGHRSGHATEVAVVEGRSAR